MKNLTRILTYSGAIPFVFLSYCLLFDLNYFFIDLDKILLLYGAVILSFLGGINFALAINSKKCNRALLLSSNFVALSGFFLYFLDKFTLALILLTSLYLYQLFIDYFCYKNKLIEKWFWKLRVVISAIVISCFLVLIFF